LYGKNLIQLDKTKKFIERLKDIFVNMEVVWIDERFTSFEAESILKEVWIYSTRGKKDDISAQIILDSYLWRKK
jgi:RNase H-fold protein (predicted Holliday junction resolvase)